MTRKIQGKIVALKNRIVSKISLIMLLGKNSNSDFLHHLITDTFHAHCLSARYLDSSTNETKKHMQRMHATISTISTKLLITSALRHSIKLNYLHLLALFALR